MNTVSLRLADIGEKALIRSFIKPFFNASDDPRGVGDDCAMIAFGSELALISTDRVPSDLWAFKSGILDHRGLGDYLARLNLSDTAACGGHPVGLLLNLGLPDDIAYADVEALCRGFGDCAARHGTSVLGGDITSAGELSISATSIGRAPRECVLTRRGARPGDSIFLSRPLGMTPAALAVVRRGLGEKLTVGLVQSLWRQFSHTEPMLALGQALGASGQCGACMDNTDGIGQSLTELGEASQVALVLHRDALTIPPEVEAVGALIGQAAVDFAFDAGADFSLVGTLRGTWTSEQACARFGDGLEIVGNVEEGDGVWMDDGSRTPLRFRGWNYFSVAQREGRLASE